MIGNTLAEHSSLKVTGIELMFIRIVGSKHEEKMCNNAH